jgi:hypothetical protein
MLGELLPISDGALSHATLRRHALAVGSRLDQRVSEPDEHDWPESRRDSVPSCTRLIVRSAALIACRSTSIQGSHETELGSGLLYVLK